MKKTNLKLNELEIAILKNALDEYKNFWKEQTITNMMLGLSYDEAIKVTALNHIESLQAKLFSHD